MIAFAKHADSNKIRTKHVDLTNLLIKNVDLIKLYTFIPPQSDLCISDATFFFCPKFELSLEMTQRRLVKKHSLLMTLLIGRQPYLFAAAH